MHAVVAASKLAIPVSRRPLVPRPELCERLEGDYRVGLVSAPAGYGKTAILASWAEIHDGRVAWLSCDALDAEPTRFMSGLLAAIARQWPGAADDASVLLEREGANTYDPAVAVANDLTAMAETGVIVIDDLHLAAPSPVMLSAFIGALPEGFRLVIGSRSDPPLSLGRLRVRGELLELRGDDLRFGPEELSAFLQLHDVPMGGTELERLHELTEGWPAGAQLAAIAMQRGARHDDLLRALATTDRGVGDFLLGEALSSLPDELVDFLVRTSVLDAFDAELCTAVTGVEGSADILERLVAANLFVVPLDGRDHWYRYHHLFGSFLRARLASWGPTRVRAAHEDACRALEACGDVAGALREAMLLGDVDRAGRILRSALTRSLNVPKSGFEVTAQALRLWLHEFGAAHVATDPEWVLEFVVALIMVSGAEEAPRWLESVRQAHPDADDRLRAMIEGAWGEHHVHHGQPQQALDRLANAVAAVGWDPPDHSMLPVLPTAIARAHLQAGDVDAARTVLSRVMHHPVGNAVADEVRNPAIAAFVAALDGELGRADRAAAEADAAADRLGLVRHDLGRVFAALARAEVHLERNRDQDATALLDEVREVCETSRRVTLQGLVVLQQARLARVVGDEAGAMALLERARFLYEDPDEAVARVLAEEAAAQALRFAPASAPALIDALDESRPATGVLRAKLALLRHDDRLAASVLAELPPPTSRAEGVRRSVLCGLAVLARDVERANVHVRDALGAGEPEGLIRTIADQGPDVHRLLQSYAPDRRQQPYVEQLLAVTGRAVAPARRRVATTLVEPLSERELTVLRYLCSRLTYQEIAAALYVSLNTLKSHVRSVYRKLGVASRTDAVDSGRRSGLI